MAIESEKFVFSSVQPLWQESREITTNPRPPVKVGISALDVCCKACSHSWTSHSYGEGRFAAAVGNYLFTCPSCGSEEGVKASVLMNSL